MSFIDQITPLLITFNEAPNIARTLDKLRWARRIIVVDSGSTDGTLEIVARYPQAEVIARPFDSAATQCNFGLDRIQTEWVLSMDADYELDDGFIQELRELQVPAEVDGYSAKFVYRIFGRRLRGSLYPPRTVLYRVRGARYVDEGHTQRIKLAGGVRNLRGVIYHDDRKSLSRWLTSQQKYASLEADHLLTTTRHLLSLSDWIRRTGWLAPILVFFYALIIKGCILDGWAGWAYVLQRTVAEGIIALEITDRRISGQASAQSKNQ